LRPSPAASRHPLPDKRGEGIREIPSPRSGGATFTIALLFIALALPALARFSGGDSFSGGGSSGGGGGGDGWGEIVYLIIRFLWWLTLEHPAIGIPVDVVVITMVIAVKRSKAKTEATVLRVTTSKPARRSAKLDALRRFDPNFSEITFADFCYSLYAKVHIARGAGELMRYAPYLSASARKALEVRGRNPVSAVIIGAFTTTGIAGLDTPTVTVSVEFQSNMTENGVGWYVRETWRLERKRDILSPPPEKAKADHCPRCGGALSTRANGTCEYCGERIVNGAFQWYVRAVTLTTRENRGPLLTSNVPEAGTLSPTVLQPQFETRRKNFDIDWNAFTNRVRELAIELQRAWTDRDWERVRPLETEPLFQMHRYWIDAYRAQKLRNVVDGFTVTRIEPVKIDSDAFYDAITVRLWAEGRDYTCDEAGNVVAGSRDALRQWSEYWTLIRARMSAPDLTRCPNCAAPVRVGATGVCEFCGGKITAAAFDWVLSRVEQDEVYGG